MTVVCKPLFVNLQKGKEYNRTDLIAFSNYEHVRLCFILVPLRGKSNLRPRPQNKILVPFRGHSKKIRRTPPSLLYGSPPAPRRNLSNCEVGGKKVWGISAGFEPVASAFALQCSTGS